MAQNEQVAHSLARVRKCQKGKDLGKRGVCKKVTGLDGLIWKELEELPGGPSFEARAPENVPSKTREIITQSGSLSND